MRLRDSNGAWPQRYPLTFYNASGTADKDGEITIPAHFGAFWESIDADAHEMRITGSDGETLLVFQRAAFTLASRSLTLEIENIPVQDATTKTIWLYWGQADAADGAGTFTASTPLSGELTNLTPTGQVLAFQSERPGASSPSQTVSKTVDETQDVYWSLAGVLAPSAVTDGGYTDGEEVDAVSFAVYDASSAQAAMIEAVKTKVVQVGGTLYVRTRWKAGSAGTYTLRLTVITSTGRTAQARAVGYVTDLQEPA